MLKRSTLRLGTKYVTWTCGHPFICAWAARPTLLTSSKLAWPASQTLCHVPRNVSHCSFWTTEPTLKKKEFNFEVTAEKP